MKKILSLLLLVLLLGGCGSPGESTSAESMSDKPYQEIKPAAAQKMLAEQEVILIDVRTAEEYAAGHIENSCLIPDYELAEQAEQELADKDAVIMVYCRSGRRSADAAQTLADLGYSRVYDLGGIIDWPYKLVK